MVNLICFTKLEWNWDTNRAVTLGRLLGNLPLPPRLHIFKPSKRSIIYPLLMYLFCFESSFNASQSVNILIYPYESLFSFAAILFSFFPKIFSLPQVFFFRRRSFSFARSFFLLPWHLRATVYIIGTQEEKMLHNKKKMKLNLWIKKLSSSKSATWFA